MKIKNIITLSFLFSLILISVSCGQDKIHTKTKNGNTIVSEYDSVRANKLGADIYGMKKFVLAFLKRGPNREKDPEKAAALQKAHLENIDRLAEEGNLVLAGPFLDGGDIRGIYIFDVESVEEAEALTNTDPAIKAGSLVMELKPWYGSAALLKINDIHKIIAEQNP